MLSLGTPLPAFSTEDEGGAYVSPKSLQGHWTVLYFYPKDNTPGCTAQACSFRDELSSFTKKGIVVYGISADSPKSHLKFKDKFQLTFPLLVDFDHKLAELFEVWVEKSLYGRKYMGIERSTYVINPEGIIVGTYQKVEPKDHAQLIFAEVLKLQTAAGK